MMSSVLSMLGQDRAFELFEFLIMLFVLISVATLIAVAIYVIRSHRSARASERRLEGVLRHLGRGLFGEDAWDTVERSLSHDPRRIDTFLSVIDRESFDVWAGQAERTGTVDPSDVKLLRDRLTRTNESHRHSSAPARVSECNPTFGMPVAVQQSSSQTRGTIAELAKRTFTMWILGDVNEFDDTREASFVLLSRSGTYQFDARFTKQPDGMLIVERPAQTLRSQRRRFDRHPARLPVNVARLLSDGHPTEAVITELSGGGATVTNPASSFSEGHVLNLSFVAGGRSYTVAGRVVRAEDDGSLHVRFEAMRDQEREAIAESVAIIEPIGSPR
jgi:PilZ domain-containing protein